MMRDSRPTISDLLPDFSYSATLVLAQGIRLLMPLGISALLVDTTNVNERAICAVMANACMNSGHHE
jgi:hypothetical protein